MCRTRNKAAKDRDGKEDLRCSFCNKAQRDIGKLIAGPEVYICDEGIRVCPDIMEDNRPSTEMPRKDTSPSRALPVSCALCGMLTSPDSPLLVENKGILCPICLEEVQAAVAARDERDPK